MNDPNGLVYYRGQYHLYFQHNPIGNTQENMSWGHASSSDLVNWHEHPVAIRYGIDEQVYSGSVVIDHQNSSGFGTNEEPPFVAVYTSAYSGKQAQSLAFSTDVGMTWTKYEGNPVLDRDSEAFRDPKVFWHVPENGNGYWMMVAVEATERKVVFYRSTDLKEWAYASTFKAEDSDEGLWECPDLFSLPVDDSHTAWVLLVSVDPGRGRGGSFTEYFVGHFDGTEFVADSPSPQRLDWGRDLYAAVTFNNAPHNRRIAIGWMSNWDYASEAPTYPWRGTMSVPRELSLRTIRGRLSVTQTIPDVVRLLEQPNQRKTIRDFDLEGSRQFSGAPNYRLQVTFEPIDATGFALEVCVGNNQRTRLSYDVQSQSLSLDRTNSGITSFEPSFPSVETTQAPLCDGEIRLDVLVDTTSVEIFCTEGSITMTDAVFPDESSIDFAVRSVGGITRVRDVEWVVLGSHNYRSAAEPVAGLEDRI